MNTPNARPRDVRARLGEILVQANLITDDQLATAVGLQAVRGGRLGEILVSLNYVTEDELLNVLAKQTGIAIATLGDLRRFVVKADTADAFGRALAEEDVVFPVWAHPETNELLRAQVDAASVTLLTSRSALRAFIDEAHRAMEPEEVDITPTPATAPGHPPHRHARRQIRVLLVDAEPAVREALETILSSEGHVIVGAENRAHALAALENGVFDILMSRSPAFLSDTALVAEFHARNPFGEVMIVPPIAEKVFGERVDAESLFRFLFNCFDQTLRLLAGADSNERVRARDAAQLARDVGWVCGLNAKQLDEVFLAVFLDGMDELLTSRGYPPGTALGAERNAIVLQFLAAMASPYDLGPLLAHGDQAGAPGAAIESQPLATRVVRAVAEYRRLLEKAGPKAKPASSIDALRQVCSDERVVVALTHVVEQRTRGRIEAVERPTVLLVDTDPEALARTEARLGAACRGAVIQAVSNGRDALSICQRGGVAVVIAETDLSGIDGFRLCFMVKHEASTSGIRFFFVTREAEPDKIRKGLDAGADDYIIKPPNYDLLAVKTARALEAVP